MTESSPPYPSTLSSNYPIIRQCFKDIEAIAGFRLTPQQRASFLRYHAYITTDPKPQYITEFRTTGRRYHIHVNGILGDAQNALACVYYHLAHLDQMEIAVERVIESSGLRERLGESATAGGNTLALDFEYQAFVLSIRRCLDYLTRGLAIYFKNDFHSFRRLGAFLAKAMPQTVAIALREAHARHVANFDFVLSESERRSTRDRISHYEFVPAGVVNISKRGFVLAGGGENLLSYSSSPPPTLRQVLHSHATNLQNCIDDLLDTFVDTTRKYEALVI
jgi:hypothetical protein